jgi:hypothetical protein
MLEDLSVLVYVPTHVLSDSTGVINIARDLVRHELTEHIGVDASYTQAQV